MTRFLVFACCLCWSVTVLAADNEATILTGLKSHDHALHLTDGWVRDPYIYLASDGYYYFTGTMPQADDPRETTDKYNTGLGPESIVGYKLRVWRSRDLANWESLGEIFSAEDGYWYKQNPAKFDKVGRARWFLWAPELHFLDGRWAIVFTSPSPAVRSNLLVTKSDNLAGPFEFPLGDKSAERHDPSLFRDDDGSTWLVFKNTQISRLTKDFSDFVEGPLDVGPSDRKIGHEGCTIRKIGTKYVLFGTAWSTDVGRHGTYNLYYCTADKITGPYGPRRFAGRFLGHGTPFQDKSGQWWCTAFFNGNVPPIAPEESRARPLDDDAYTINPQGMTIVPLEVKTLADGDVSIRALDPNYARPGLEEVQKFDLR